MSLHAKMNTAHPVLQLSLSRATQWLNLGLAVVAAAGIIFTVVYQVYDKTTRLTTLEKEFHQFRVEVNAKLDTLVSVAPKPKRVKIANPFHAH